MEVHDFRHTRPDILIKKEPFMGELVGRGEGELDELVLIVPILPSWFPKLSRFSAFWT
jgi:hypothetical protein